MEFLFATLFSNIFWTLYFGIGAVMSVICIKIFDPVVFFATLHKVKTVYYVYHEAERLFKNRNECIAFAKTKDARGYMYDVESEEVKNGTKVFSFLFFLVAWPFYILCKLMNLFFNVLLVEAVHLIFTIVDNFLPTITIKKKEE